MTDPREALAHAILDALRESAGEYDTLFLDRSPLTFVCIDGRVNMLTAVDTLLAEFLVVPRSEVTTEYGVEYKGIVHGNVANANAAKRRAVKVFDQPAEAARRRLVWAGPWSPLPENGER